MSTWTRGYKILGLAVLIYCLVMLGIPALLVRGCGFDRGMVEESNGRMVRVQLAPGRVVTLPLETYLIGVVAAEMPAKFDIEALKAQAVAARTYTLLRINGKASDRKHPDAALCADPGHCQAWLSLGDLRKRWGLFAFGSNYEKVASAVRATAGEVLVYRDELIDPVYHASCGGRGTEDAREVWGRDIPYLKRVPCRWDPPERQGVVATSFSMKDFFTRLGITGQAVPASNAGDLVQVLDRTGSGRVRRVEIASQVFRGVELRKALGLRSTDFTVSAAGGKVTFYTRGYGHAVGMCQYGAQGLALRGQTYRQILEYYYRGAVMKKLPEAGN